VRARRAAPAYSAPAARAGGAFTGEREVGEWSPYRQVRARTQRSEGMSEQSEVTVRIPNIFSWLPEDFRNHMRAAQREQLLAMRALIDAAIDRIDEKQEPRSSRRVDIAVE